MSEPGAFALAVSAAWLQNVGENPNASNASDAVVWLNEGFVFC